jgi:predicted phosphate transport protein (TIGR00153 family)
MKLNLIPKNDTYFELFNKATNNLVIAATYLTESLKNPEKAAENTKAIQKIEHDGDEIVAEISKKLTKTFITPFDSEDIHELKSIIDSILDSIDSIAERMLLYNVQQIPKAAVELSQELVTSTKLLSSLMDCLRQMKCDDDLIEAIKKSERAGDKTYRKAIADLFSDGYEVLEVIKWKDLYEDLEDAIDFCREAAITVEGIILKHA